MNENPQPSQVARVTQDRGFKALFSTYPIQAIETLAPEILRQRGKPVAVTVSMQQEVPLSDLGQPSRYLDVAMHLTFADGTHIVLVEHWSRARDIRWRGVNLYVASLLVQYEDAEVFPVLVITDPGDLVVPDRWTMSSCDLDVVTLRVRIVRVTQSEVPRLRALRNRVAAALLALAIPDSTEAAVQAAVAFKDAPGTDDDFRRFLPFLEDLARLAPEDFPEYRRRLRQEPSMSAIEAWLAEAKAEGMAEAKAKGELVAILHLVAKGRLTVTVARAEIAELVAEGSLTQAQADEALAQLPER